MKLSPITQSTILHYNFIFFKCKNSLPSSYDVVLGQDSNLPPTTLVPADNYL